MFKILIMFMASVSLLLSSTIIEGERDIPTKGSHAMVVTSHYLATKEAIKVLKEGGNAVDAAVVSAFVLAVVQPRSGNIGGGGFMMISLQKKHKVIAIDYRETAPALATKDMFLNKNKDVDIHLSRASHLSSGVPGTVAGLLLALKKYGTISRARALAPAIKLAQKGFIIPPRFAEGLVKKRDFLQKNSASKKKFYKRNGSYYKVGERFVQKDLAKTLKRISKYGVKGFYQGTTAKLIVIDMKEHGGLITLNDLKNYKPVIREPIVGTYRGYKIYSMPPPSSGGVHIVQMLNILENFDLKKSGLNSAKSMTIMAEAMKRAYADRSKYLGDPDFVKIPIKYLTSKKYAKKIAEDIKNEYPDITPSKDIAPAKIPGYEENETTHFSIADKYGNMVANTFTINGSYGSGKTVPNAGFLLNNEMDDFSSKPGAPNAYGLVGGKANSIKAHKRMLSSMTPTIVMKNGKNFLATGTPGGSRIITTTLQIILNTIDYGLNVQVAVDSPRMHHQWLPDEIRIEQGFSPDTIKILKDKGYKVVVKESMGAANSVMIKDGKYYGGVDHRRDTGFALGY